MRRVKKPIPLARRDPDGYILQLDAEPATWPAFLHAAWEIVAKEMSAPDQARQAVIDAVRPANKCARAIAARLQATTSDQSREVVVRAAKRISTRIKRIPAAARRALDDVARHELGEEVNSETIGTFLTGCSKVMLAFPESQLAQEIQHDLSGRSNAATAATLDEGTERPTIHLVHEFDAMPPLARRDVEDRLAKILRECLSLPSALDIFSAIGDSLKARSPAAIREYVGDLHVTYVSEVAEVWRRLGLRPARSTLLDKPDHKSRFHRFLELVLRDHLDLNLRRKTLPGDRYEWQISDEDLKTALADHSQKNT
jgi:hypothetical protein